MKNSNFISAVLAALALALALASTALAADTVITMQLGSPNMTVNGTVQPIDNEGTTATTVNGRTMLPLRAIAEALGLTVEWDGDTQTVTLRSASENADNAPTTDQTANTEAESKVLVAYFSATGNTETVAGYIANTLGADIYEIEAVEPYTTADLDWTNSASRVSVEHAGGDSGRPVISGGVADMAQYDVVFIGYPIWWGEAPNILRTFMESYDFSGKTLIPFCTSSSSGLGQSGQNLHSLAEGANWLDGERFSSGASESAVAAWVNGLNIGK